MGLKTSDDKNVGEIVISFCRYNYHILEKI